MSEYENKKHNDTGIPNHLKKSFEEKSHFSLDDVRIHYHSEKPAQMKSLAYTQSNHVYIGPGQEKYLKHELGHVIQQKQGRVQANKIENGVPINDNPHLEREADGW